MMTEAVLALVPTHGLWLVMVAVALSCLALPVPGSVLVMAAGGFAAAGDLVLWQVQAAALAGCIGGDQAAYGLARTAGARLTGRLRRRRRAARVLSRAEALVTRFGPLAVFLGRTVLSPLGPYTSYVAGGLRMRWLTFSAVAGLGAVVWATAYSWMGYVFASRIDDIAALIGNATGLVLAAAVVVGLGVHLWRSWRAERRRRRP